MNQTQSSTELIKSRRDITPIQRKLILDRSISPKELKTQHGIHPQLVYKLRNENKAAKAKQIRSVKELSHEQIDLIQDTSITSKELREAYNFTSSLIHYVRSGDFKDPRKATKPNEYSRKTRITREPQMLDHNFHIRKDYSVKFQLPDDLSEDEAKRLSSFIKTLPF